MKDKIKGMLIVTGVLAVLAVGGTAIAGASGGDEDAKENDVAITGSALDKASAAALDHTGGGKVTGTEVDDEEGKYEIEVTKGGGAVDVHLDKDFKVLSQVDDKDDGNDD